MSRSIAAAALMIGESQSQQRHWRPPAEVEDDSQGIDELESQSKRPKEDIPQSARLWGFIRQLSLGEIFNAEASKNATPTENDATLWWDIDRHRFLVVSENLIIDDLSPLQFVQFVRELRDVTSRILFKFERRHDGSAGKARRVWAR
jgi:hypothetical protein